jgi:hypothetical protein
MVTYLIDRKDPLFGELANLLLAKGCGKTLCGSARSSSKHCAGYPDATFRAVTHLPHAAFDGACGGRRGSVCIASASSPARGSTPLGVCPEWICLRSCGECMRSGAPGWPCCLRALKHHKHSHDMPPCSTAALQVRRSDSIQQAEHHNIHMNVSSTVTTFLKPYRCTRSTTLRLT